MMKRLCICLLNVSEGQDHRLIERIANCATTGNNQKSAVLNVFSDKVYNRSVLTIASTAENIGQSVVAACREAYSLIDVSKHNGGHPRLGSVDLIPIHPVSADISLEECGIIACDVAQELSQIVPGTSFFLFGTADRPLNRGLVQRRKEVSWFSGKLSQCISDIGSQPNQRYGLTGIGAIPYVMNCNVTIRTSDLKIGRNIAAQLRATSENGLPGVQSMAFPHEGNIEIACNVEGFYIQDGKEKDFLIQSKNIAKNDLICCFGTLYHVPPKMIEDRIKAMASSHNIQVEENVVVGFTPADAQKLALEALANGWTDLWKSRKNERFM